MLVAPQFSNVQRREVTTYLVTAPGGPGSYHCSIQQAIDKADPYSRIVVASGQYFESITVTTPIELIGEEGDSPEILGRGTCLSVAGDVECYFENLRILYKGSAFAGASAVHAPRGSTSSVRIIGGRPTFRNCEMASMYVGGASSPVVTNCNIIGSVGGCGLVVAEEAGGTFSKNVIANHVPWCISVSSRGSPIFQENDVYQDLKVIVHNTNMKMINGGTVNVTRDGSDTDRSIAPRFIGNRIRDDYINGGGSSMATSRSHDEMANQTVYDPEFDKVVFAERSTVRIDSTCSPTFDDNHILGGCVGLHFAVGAGGTFVSNVIVASSMYGVLLETWSCPTLRVNTISRCKTGIYAEATCATLSRNTIRESEGAGMVLLVLDEDRFRMDQNTFVGNDTGIAVRPGKLSDLPNTKLIALVQRDIEQQRAIEATVAAEEAAKGNAQAHDPHSPATAAPVRGATAAAMGSLNSPTAGSTSSYAAANPQQVVKSVIQKNLVTHNRSCGVTVYGNGCFANLRDLEIVNNGKYGALCAFGCRPTFENVLFDKGDVGLVSEKSAHPTIVRCDFSGQRKACILVRDRGRAYIEGNHFQGFSGAGVLVRDAGNPRITRNWFSECRGTGILVSHGGIGRIYQNKFDTIAVGIEVSSFGDPLVENNVFFQCTEMGAYIHEEGVGTFVGNEFMMCSVGIGLNSGGEAVIRDNLITDSMRLGIVGGDEAKALIEKNDIRKSVAGNISLEGLASDCTVRRNRIHHSVGFGVRSSRSAEGLVKDNHISENGDGGLGCIQGGNTTFTGNIVRLEKGPGIRIKEGGRGVFVKNNVESGITCALELGDGADPILDQCLFTLNAQAGVHIHGGAGGLVKNCSIVKNKGGVSYLGVNCFSTVRFENVTIADNAIFGIQILEAGTGSMHDCIIHGQEIGLLLEGAGSATFERCEIHSNKIGCTITKFGTPKISHCVFRNNREKDILFASNGNGQVTHCTLKGGTPIGVFSDDHAQGRVTHCQICDLAEVAVVVKMHSQTVFEDNHIHRNMEGIRCESLSASKFLRNVIALNTKGNVLLLPRSRPTFDGNTIEYSPGSGILIDDSEAVIIGNTVQNNAKHGLEFVTITSTEGKSGEAEAVGAGRRRALAKAKAATRVLTGGRGGVEHDGVVCNKNIIRQNKLSGVYFHQFSKAELVENEICANEDGGVVVSKGAAPTLRANAISENSVAGIVIEDRGSADVQKNVIFKNFPCNVSLRDGSLGILQQNEISAGRPDGIVANNSSTNIRHNKIVRNSEGNGLLLAGPNEFLVIEENDFSFNAVGVMCSANHSSGKIQENKFTGNAIAGIRICGMAKPTVMKNIFDNGSVGVLMTTDAMGKVVENRFLRNKEAMVVHGEPILTVCSHNIFETNHFGVCLRANETYRLTQNEFGPCEEACVLVEDGSRSTVNGNDFTSSKVGILIRSQGGPPTNPTVTGNRFLSCPTGIEVIGEAAGTISRNLFSRCSLGVHVTSSESGIIVVSNIFSRSLVAGFCSEGQGCPSLVVRNLFCHNAETDSAAGLLLKNGGGGKFIENDFHENRVGVLSERGGQGEIARCLLHENALVGVLLTGKCSTQLINCAIVAKKDGVCIEVNGGSNPKVIQCLLKAEKIALHLTGGATGQYQHNVIRDSGYGTLISGSGSATLSHNYYTTCSAALVLRHRPSEATLFTQNAIQGCDIGIHCSAQGGCDVNGNVVTQCETAILLERRGSGRFSHNTLVKHSKTGVWVRGPCNAILANNVISDCSISGIHIHHQQQTPAPTPHPPSEGGNPGRSVRGGARSPAPPSLTLPKRNSTQPKTLNLLDFPSGDGPDSPRSPRQRKEGEPQSPTADGPADPDALNKSGDHSLSINASQSLMLGKGAEPESPGTPLASPAIVLGDASRNPNSQFGGVDLLSSSMMSTSLVGGGGSLSPSSGAIGEIAFIENRISHCRTNVNVTSGTGAFNRNHVHNGDYGFNIQMDATCSFDGNIVYDNVRVGMMIASRHCTLTRNEFYSPNEMGAFEAEAGFGLSRDNSIFNHCSAKLPVPSTNAPTKVAVVVDLKAPTKDLLSNLSESLRSMHCSELPDHAENGCSAIEGSTVRSAAPAYVVFHPDGSYTSGSATEGDPLLNSGSMIPPPSRDSDGLQVSFRPPKAPKGRRTSIEGASKIRKPSLSSGKSSANLLLLPQRRPSRPNTTTNAGSGSGGLPPSGRRSSSKVALG